MYCQRCGGATEERLNDGRQRPVCTGCGAVTYLDPKLAVAVVIERDGAILLGKRATWTRSPGLWSFPAGFVERGEVVEDAAIREVTEETGLAVTVGPVLDVFSTRGDAVVLLVFPALSTIGEPVAGDDLTEIGWFSPGRLPALAFPHDPEIVAAWERWRAARAIS